MEAPKHNAWFYSLKIIHISISGHSETFYYYYRKALKMREYFALLMVVSSVKYHYVPRHSELLAYMNNGVINSIMVLVPVINFVITPSLLSTHSISELFPLHYPSAHTPKHTHTHKHAQTHTPTHTRIHTHARTRTQFRCIPVSNAQCSQDMIQTSPQP